MSPFTSIESTANNVSASNTGIIGLVGAYITHYKRNNKTSDEKIAKRVGCSPPAITQLRNGKITHCSITFLSHVAEAFGLDIVTMLDEARKIPQES